MHYKQYLYLIISLILVTSSFSLDKNCNKNLQKPMSTEDQSFGLFDVNRITTHFSNDCMIASHIANGSSGMLFDGKSINYNTGLWIADSSNGTIRIAAAEYGSEFIPGAYGEEYDSLAHGILTNTNIGDQSHWYICNDGVQNNHSVFQTNPLSIEIKNTLWGYNENHENMKLTNVMFVKSIITNRGNTNIENAFIGLWADPDLGYAGDDFVGCDTTLNLAYCYNDGEDDYFGEKPPAMGIVLLQGPHKNSIGKLRENADLLPMTAFVKYT